MPALKEPDHRLCVKEYRKEAADSSMALASHLRPAPVLERTMNHLMHKVINYDKSTFRTTREWNEWHRFLWDRTRALRKVCAKSHAQRTLTIQPRTWPSRVFAIALALMSRSESFGFTLQVHTKCVMYATLLPSMSPHICCSGRGI